MRRFMRPIIAAAGLLIAFTSHGFAAEPQHRLVIQVDQNDRRTRDFALNNATDVIEHYRGLDQTVAVEIMACGPGLHMHRYVACEGTHQADPGNGTPQQDPVLGLQQHQAEYGEEGRPSA